MAKLVAHLTAACAVCWLGCWKQFENEGLSAKVQGSRHLKH